MLKLGTVFSGIGAIEHALQRMGIETEIEFACDTGDIDIFSRKMKVTIEDTEKAFEEFDELMKTKTIENIEDEVFFTKLQEEVDILKDKFYCLKTTSFEKKDLKNITDFIAMKFEKFRTYKAQQDLKKISSYEDKKKYVDNLYASKLKNNKVRQTYFANYNITDDKWHNNICLMDGTQWKDKIDLFVGGSPCFVAGTKVLTKNGYKNIEDIQVGEEVLTHKNRYCKVLRIGNTKNQEIWELISLDNSRFLATSNHPFLVCHIEENHYSDYEIKELKDITYDDYLIGFDSSSQRNYSKVISKANLKYRDTVYNIEVEEDHTYIVQDKWVHNCQSFSAVGKRRGLEDTRGTLFYEYARLIKEIQPKVFIYENVKGLLNHDKGNTWKTMQAVFDELGYNYSYQLLNATDYGIPQNRKRVFVVGFRKDLELKKDFEFPKPIPLELKMQDFLLDNVSGRYYLTPTQVKFVNNDMRLKKSYTQIDGKIALCQTKHQQFNLAGDFVFVEENKNMEKTMQELEKYFLSEKLIKCVMDENFYLKPVTDKEIASTLLKSMHKMHRAGVDNYVHTEGRLRKLTPRECLRLMGFCDSFKIVVADTPAYMQAGNSIVVDVLIYIMRQILECYDLTN